MGAVGGNGGGKLASHHSLDTVGVVPQGILLGPSHTAQLKPLALDRPVSVADPPQAAALGRCNRGPATSNRVHPLRPHRLEAAAHFPPPWGCLPVRRWKLDPTFHWAPQPRCTGPNTHLRMGDWYGRIRR